ncbi:MAG: hypothetical protein M3342_05495 [Bacteroidota bacterium]|nr:hypothetical protein [Bacteroidota bacterium]
MKTNFTFRLIIGLAIGTGLGVAFQKIPEWLAFGICIGILIEFIFKPTKEES